MTNAKMTKQTKTMVENVNEYLKTNHIKNIQDTQFNFMCWLLIKANCYHGFNYFTADGRLSGGENEKFDHLEIYIF